MPSLPVEATSAEPVAPVAGGTRERVWAWGRSTSVTSWVYRPSTIDGVRAVLDVARRGGMSVGLRGGGRSYGDAALNADQVSLDVSRMNRVLDWDPASGIIRVEPGVTIAQLWQYAIEDGWWPSVVPGTMFTTLGGCAAMNVHGKNNWKMGPLGDYVLAFDLLLPDGEIRRCTPEDDAGLFTAAIGGFGLLGCFTSLTVQLKRVHSGLLEVEPVGARTIDEMLEAIASRMESADYLVGWVDTLARGPHLGRGLVHAARYLHAGEDAEPGITLRADRQGLPEVILGFFPKAAVWRAMRLLTNDAGVRLVNAAHYRVAQLRRRRYRQSHAAFAFLLDYVPEWQRAYGPGGLIQYQSFIPAASASAVFRDQLRLAQARGVVPYLGVLKRHRADRFLMTHAVDGYSLALDFRVTARNRAALWALAADLDGLVTAAGGRFYLAKDSTLTRASYVRALGEDRLRRFLELKRACDPENLLQTDAYRRLIAPR
jgi:decaprenylphospho-beta-D-ribofuranose 2-oxidase